MGCKIVYSSVLGVAKYQKLKGTEAVFLVMLGTSSFPARHGVFSCFPIYLVPG